MFEKTLFGRIFQNFGVNLRTRDDYLVDTYSIKKDGAEKKNEVKQELIWINVISIFFIHIYAVYVTLTYYRQLTVTLFLWGAYTCLLGGLGVTGGAHRLWSHKSYKAKLPFRIFLLFCFTLSGQNSIYDWVRDHRVHHKFSETDADPHNVKRGFFFAHVGWLMMRKHPEVYEKGKTIDMSDIDNDPLLAFHRNYFIPLKIIIAFIIPTIIPPLVWGESWKMTFLMVCVVKYVFLLNSTWSVNSAAHIWGNKPFDKSIKPAENIWVSLWALGEGWHNYHHVFPWDYKAAEIGPYWSNITTLFIDMAAKLGLAYDLKHPSDELILETAKKRGDGSWTHCHGEEVKCE
ncbi:acyl-CoA Delta-9 desaturase [Halyomorpha halys]|uniref:acyl-CoA Delta-9 desaturase n=1 Tax=Halyomorpha halys TaxID=286706 RepID=UPI0006D50ACB|nr:acyl-CoA desaturase [Halyomorpha halys]